MVEELQRREDDRQFAEQERERAYLEARQADQARYQQLLQEQEDQFDRQRAEQEAAYQQRREDDRQIAEQMAERARLESQHQNQAQYQRR